MSYSFWTHLAGPAVRSGGRPGVTEILPHLLVGEYPTPADADWLRDAYRISVVVSLQDDMDLARKGLDALSLEAAYAAAGIEFRRLPIPDGDQDVLRSRLEEALVVLRERMGAGKRVFLHCNAGLNRAPTVAVAYLHACRGLSLEQAGSFVKARRACVPYMRLLESYYGQACQDA
jgi:protein-tyrosine phosphatase